MSIRRCLELLRAGLLGLLLVSVAHASNDEVDHLELAALLVKDAEYARALEVLAQVDPQARGVDLVKYHTLQGLVALSGTPSRPDDAIVAFQASIAAGQSEPSIYLFLAQAQFGQQRYTEVLQTLELPQVQDSFASLASIDLMRAQANWLLQRHQPALAALAVGQRKFPANTAFARREVFYLMELGLFQEAAARGRSYLAAGDGKLEDYLEIGAALRRARQLEEAIAFLETARLRFADDERVVKALAATHLEYGRPLVAAEMTYTAALRNPALLVEAAELFHRAGHPARALQLNTRIADQPAKLRQRLGILVELGRYAEVAGMEAALLRAGLADDQEVRYALAYAWFKQADFGAVERNLQVLTKPELFRKATELRKLMADCAGERWKCT